MAPLDASAQDPAATGPVPQLAGGCRCGNVAVQAGFTVPVDRVVPRLCDCGFCRARNAAWVSDPAGTLRVRIGDSEAIEWLRQGDGLARFLACARCGGLVAVACDADGLTRAALNARVLAAWPRFPAGVSVSPRMLAPNEKLARWSAVWFRDVDIGP